MAVEKRFKTYDRKFKHLIQTDEKQSEYAKEQASKIDRWEAEVFQWPQQRVQYAVYEAPDAESWQRFRVSMKGLSTRMKLHHLQERRIVALGMLDGQYQLEMIRIDNYIGALVRGGQLDTKYRVIK